MGKTNESNGLFYLEIKEYKEDKVIVKRRCPSLSVCVCTNNQARAPTIIIKTEREGFSQPSVEVEGSGAEDTDLHKYPAVSDN